jgi:hypothetical protein
MEYEEFTLEEQLYLKQIEKIENIMVVLDDALGLICERDERLHVVEQICTVLNLEFDACELWVHLRGRS